MCWCNKDATTWLHWGKKKNPVYLIANLADSQNLHVIGTWILLTILKKRNSLSGNKIELIEKLGLSWLILMSCVLSENMLTPHPKVLILVLWTFL